MNRRTRALVLTSLFSMLHVCWKTFQVYNVYHDCGKTNMQIFFHSNEMPSRKEEAAFNAIFRGFREISVTRSTLREGLRPQTGSWTNSKLRVSMTPTNHCTKLNHLSFYVGWNLLLTRLLLLIIVYVIFTNFLLHMSVSVYSKECVGKR